MRHGSVDVSANLATEDPDATLEDKLAVVEAKIAAIATDGVKSFQINGRGVEYDTGKESLLLAERRTLLAAIYRRDNPGQFMGHAGVTFVSPR